MDESLPAASLRQEVAVLSSRRTGRSSEALSTQKTSRSFTLTATGTCTQRRTWHCVTVWTEFTRRPASRVASDVDQTWTQRAKSRQFQDRDALTCRIVCTKT